MITMKPYDSAIALKEPSNDGWIVTSPDMSVYNCGYPAMGYRNQKHQLCVISGVAVPNDHPFYYISVCLIGAARASSAQANIAVVDFDMLDAEEDNYRNAFMRSFWLAVGDKYKEETCACKSEPQIIADNGDFVYSSIHDK